MTDMSLFDNAAFDQIASDRIFSVPALPGIATVKAKAAALLRFGLVATLSAASVAGTMFVIGTTMNCVFN
jgi:hypothetical protein